MQPVLDKLKDHLITKNVAADIAHKLCVSVAAKLEGKVSKLLQRFTHDVGSYTESLLQYV